MADHEIQNRLPSDVVFNPHGAVVEAIQSRGCLLRFDASLEHIRQVSANLADHLAIAVGMALKSRASELLGNALQRRLQIALQKKNRLPAALLITREVRGQDRQFYLMAYRSQDDIVVEFEPLSDASDPQLMPILNEWSMQFATTNEIKPLLQILTKSVQMFTGFERVMLCEFDQRGHRTVIAESCRIPERSLLQYRLPAADIPKMVRDRYAENPLRYVPDVLGETVPLIPSHDGELPLLDMTGGYLQTLSPQYQTYLHNNDVKAVLTIAIHSHKRLWGILVCHNFSPFTLSPAKRNAAFNIVLMASQRLFLLQQLQDAAFFQKVMDSRELLSAERGLISKPGDLFEAYGRGWLELFDLCGIALVYGERVSSYAETLDAYEIDIVAKWLNQQNIGRVWCCQRLNDTPIKDLVDLRNRGGLMAVRLPVEDGKNGWVLMFRKAKPEKNRWLASRDVLSEITEGQLTRVPGMSAEVWQEFISDRSAVWTKIQQKAALDLSEDLAVAINVNEITELNSLLHTANEQLEKIAHTDSLTQVWNRYRIEQAIDAELSAAERYQRPLSVLLFDIDQFKQVNDTHGHETGDTVLTRLASEVHNQLRGTDFLGRWGGEEFIVLASNNLLTEAANLAERLRKHIANINFSKVGKVTISIGVAQWQMGESRRALLDRADKAMYQAKKNGRNLVKLAQ